MIMWVGGTFRRICPNDGGRSCRRKKKTSREIISVYPYSTGLAFDLSSYNINTTEVLVEIFDDIIISVWMNGRYYDVTGVRSLRITSGLQPNQNILTFGYSGDVGSKARATVTATRKPLPLPPKNIPVIAPSSITVTSLSNLVWYSVSFLSSRTLHVDTLSNATSLDTFIGVYKADGTVLIQNDDVGTGSYTSSLTVVLEPGIYFIALGMYPLNFQDEFIVGSQNPLTGNIVLNITWF